MPINSEIKPHFYKSCWSCGTFCAAPRLPVAEPVYSADAVYDQVRESTVLAVENAKHAVGMA